MLPDAAGRSAAKSNPLMGLSAGCEWEDVRQARCSWVTISFQVGLHAHYFENASKGAELGHLPVPELPRQIFQLTGERRRMALRLMRCVRLEKTSTMNGIAGISPRGRKPSWGGSAFRRPSSPSVHPCRGTGSVR